MSERNVLAGWQACPVCQGTGMFSDWRDSSALTARTCPVCMGSRIISTVTGLPPAVRKESDNG
jgi:DnaJ-class molecular chaperone